MIQRAEHQCLLGTLALRRKRDKSGPAKWSPGGRKRSDLPNRRINVSVNYLLRRFVFTGEFLRLSANCQSPERACALTLADHFYMAFEQIYTNSVSITKDYDKWDF